MLVYYYFNPKIKNNSSDGDVELRNAGKDEYAVLADILTNKRIKISKIDSVNDPFDFQVSFDVTTSEAYVRGFRRKFKQIGERSGIVCFSENLHNVLMWSHYADKHQGLVLGLDLDANALTQVDYLPIAPRVIHGGGECADCPSRFHGLMSAVMRTKLIDWAYEKEWRLILDYSDKKNVCEEKSTTGKIIAHYYLLPPNSIRSLCVGLRCKLKMTEIFDRLHRCGLDQVSVYKMEQGFDGYSLCESYKGSYVQRQKQIKLYLGRMIDRTRNELLQRSR